jgi:hypothetical protein
VPGPLGHTLTMGIFDLHNKGASPVTVTSVRLPSAHGMTITKSWLIPIFRKPGQDDLVGEQASYPPATWPEWAKRQPIPGAVIRPGQDLNLVFGVTRTTARSGHSAGPVVAYTAGGSTYTVQEQTSLVMVANNCGA